MKARKKKTSIIVLVIDDDLSKEAIFERLAELDKKRTSLLKIERLLLERKFVRQLSKDIDYPNVIPADVADDNRIRAVRILWDKKAKKFQIAHWDAWKKQSEIFFRFIHIL